MMVYYFIKGLIIKKLDMLVAPGCDTVMLKQSTRLEHILGGVKPANLRQIPEKKPFIYRFRPKTGSIRPLTIIG